MGTITNIKKIDYIIVFMMLFFSGNPMCEFYLGKYASMCMLLILVCIYLFCNVSKINGTSEIYKWIFVSVLLFLLQAISLSRVSIPADVNHIIRLLCGYFCMAFVGIKFRYTYLRVITFLAAVSLLFFMTQVFAGKTFGFYFLRYQSIGLYNVICDEFGILSRNCGMFWEPGAYQGYLVLVPLLFIDNLRWLWNSERKRCIILLSALLTTQSTTGYVVFFVVIGLSILHEMKGLFSKLLTLSIIISIAFYAFFSFDFLGDKISEQAENAASIQSGEASWTRMGAMQIDKENIARHPFVGNGFLMDSLYGNLGEEMVGSGNGFTGAINRFGIPFMIMYLACIYSCSTGKDNYQKGIVVLAFILLLNGEFFLNYMLFWALVFLRSSKTDYLLYKKNKR